MNTGSSFEKYLPYLLCFSVILASGCRSGIRRGEADAVQEFVKAARSAGLDAKLVAGFEPRALISLNESNQFGRIPTSADVLLEMEFEGLTLNKKHIDAFRGRMITKLVFNRCSIDAPAFVRLCDLVEVDDFIATEVGFASEDSASSIGNSLNARFVNIEHCEREFTETILRSLGSFQDVKVTTQDEIRLTLASLERTRNLNLTGVDIDIADGDRFSESKSLETVVIGNGTVTAGAISELLRVRNLRALVLTDVVVEGLSEVVFPTSLLVPDIRVSGNKELQALLLANCPDSTVVNGSSGRRAGDDAEGEE